MGLEALLVQEVGTIAVAVQVGCLDHLQVRLLELVTGLECLVKDRAGEEVAHLQADQGLAAPGGGGVHLRIQTVEGSAFKLEKHFTLYVDGIDQCGHDFLKDRLRSRRLPWSPIRLPLRQNSETPLE